MDRFAAASPSAPIPNWVCCAMITTNVYNRVFFIRGGQYGTAFTLDIKNKQYLITARHLLADPENTESVLFLHEGVWKTLRVNVIGVARGEVDIAVLAPAIRLSPAFPLEATQKDMVLGQDMYFVGYPYKMWADMGEILGGRPAPFIKKGTLSSAFSTADSARRLFVDAINNEGFSGGPLLFKPQGQIEFRVAGVVAGFKTEYETVLDEHGEKTNMTVAYNTGFLLAYDIKYAVDMIAANPAGLPIAEQA